MSNYYPSFEAGQTGFRVMQDAGRVAHINTAWTTWTVLLRYSLTEYTSLTGNLTVYVTGIKLSSGDAVSFTQELGVKRLNGGNADIIGVPPVPKFSKDPAVVTADMRVTESGTDVVVEVKAANASSTDWCGQILVNHMFGLVA